MVAQVLPLHRSSANQNVVDYFRMFGRIPEVEPVVVPAATPVPPSPSQPQTRWQMRGVSAFFASMGQSDVSVVSVVPRLTKTGDACSQRTGNARSVLQGFGGAE